MSKKRATSHSIDLQRERLSTGDRLLEKAVATAAALSAAAVLAVFVLLAYFAVPALTANGIDTFARWEWNPTNGQYGTLPMIVGSVALSLSAMAIAFPYSLLVAAFSHGVGPAWLARVVSVVVHLMTGIPTIVYAFAAVVTLPPLMRNAFSTGSGFSLLTATLVLAVLVTPTIVLLIESSWRNRAPRVALTCDALGLDRARAVFGVLIPTARPELVAAFSLGFGRALGDTMIALVLSGNAAQVPSSPLDSVRALTAHIGMVLATEVGSAAYQSVFISGLVLLLLTGTLSALVRKSFREHPA